MQFNPPPTAAASLENSRREISQNVQRLSAIDLFVQNLVVSGALLDEHGCILEVSAGWREFARAGGLALENYGVGLNYLKYAIYPDADSVATLRGLKSVLARKIDVFSTIYPCDTPVERKWFMLNAFAIDAGSRAAAAAMHIDVTPLLKARSEVSAVMVGVGPEAIDPAIEKLIGVVRHTLASSKGPSSHVRVTAGSSKEQKLISALTIHQLSLLRELGRGATNSEIAKAHGISLNSAKSQTAALTRRLGFSNRTQAALFAARNGLAE